MFGSEQDALLQKSLGSLPGVILVRSLRHDIDELAKPLLPAGRVAAVFDKNTGEVLGERVCRALNAVPVRLAGVAATMAAVEHIRREAAGCSALVAIGSGTINDLCKYAAFADDKPYLVFPTAGSMNGYTSANASIAVDGYKATLPACLPRGIFCDLSVIAAAPARLSRSGLGDSLARPTAQADWLLSHLLLGTDYNEVPFELLKPFEPQLFDSARGIGKGDAESIELLMKLLLLSGFGMAIAGGSYPASQGEHMMAHTYEMAEMHNRQANAHSPPALHGEGIGVTTLFMAMMQESLLRVPPALRPMTFLKEKIIKLFGEKAADEAGKAYRTKQQRIMESKLDSRLRGNSGWWESIAGRIEKIHLPPSRIASVLKDADAPATPEDLGWDRQIYDAAAVHARCMRDRFTFLDLDYSG